jgi:hypothetical protein
MSLERRKLQTEVAMNLSVRQSILARILPLAIVTNGLVLGVGSASPVAAQRRPVVVKADQPNVWTMEQAHYLLAQMHRRDLDLRAKKLEDLDPNAINGLRFDLLRMLIEAGVSFNEASGFTNKLLKQNKQFDAERRNQLIADRDKLRHESLQLTRDISDLQIQKAKAGTDEEKAQLTAQIDAKTSLQAKVDKQIEQDDNEIKTLGDGSGNFESTTPEVAFDKSKLPESVFDDAFKDAAKSLIEHFNESPNLNATLMLENFLQMQYEIVSKQLTLLRDEVGPGERLLFLELPQTINASHDSNNRWAQSWWKIVGYTWRCEKGKDCSERHEVGTPRNDRPIATLEDYNSLLEQKDINVQTTQEVNGTRKRVSRSYSTKFKDLDEPIKSEGELGKYLRQKKFPNNKDLNFTNQIVRAVELIPRQSSLNVNDMKLRNRAGVFSAVASFLFGFGARLNVERQREQFSQFVQQELYSSAFGKGSREFGWTFTPMPGTDRLMSGVRTTYAAVIVPDIATSLVVQSNGCYFPRSSFEPNEFNDTFSSDWQENTSRNCGLGKTFIVSIPSSNIDGNNDFFVSGLTYTPAPKGGRVVVNIYGENFSAQTGLLINGTPLTPAIGVAQPLIVDDSAALEKARLNLANEKVQGSIERVDSKEIVATFTMGPDFVGTPTITVVAPGKSLDLNSLKSTDGLHVNGTPNTTLDLGAYMFGDGPPKPVDFRIDAVRLFRNQSPGSITLVVTGTGFANTGAGYPAVLVNGAPPTSVGFDSNTLMRIVIPAKSDATIQVALISKNADPTKIKTIQSDPIPNTTMFSVSDVTVLNYTEGTKTEPATLVVKITGRGFTDKLKSSIGELAVKSATEAILTITKPKAATTVTLTDEQTRQTVKIVVTRAKKAASEQ